MHFNEWCDFMHGIFSKKLRGHIGLGLCLSASLSVRPSVRPIRFAYGQERLEIGS